MPSKLTVRLWLSCCLLLFATTIVHAQSRNVSGKVLAPDNQPVAGATVVVKGTNTATQTGIDGLFTLAVPNTNSVLVVTSVGFDPQEVTIGENLNITVTLKFSTSSLNEVVITGYTAQRKKDIIGAVSIVKTEDLQVTPAANLAVQLQGRAAGVVVSSAGEPGAMAVVRIRGFASAGNNDPLYIVDGVPTTNPAIINPMDIESLQILKDATSASIYGARATNGVIIITTKQGKSGRSNIVYDSYVGTQKITKGMIPDMINTEQYIEYLTRTNAAGFSHRVFGNYGSLSVPDFIVVSNAFKGGLPSSDPRTNPDLYNSEIGASFHQILATSEGTDWFEAITQPGLMTSQQITATGGTDKANYSVGLNYFKQKGTFVNTDYERYTLRANTSFSPKKFFRIGENLQLSYEDRLGGANRGEGDAWASAYRMVPYIPVYDIKGGWGGNGVGESGNGSNPVAGLFRGKDNTNTFYRLFGNVYADVFFTPWLSARTSFGLDYGNQFEKIIVKKTYERSENVGTTQLTEQGWWYLNWTFTNTLTFQKTFAEDHDVKVLVGTEAIKANSRGVRAFGQNFDFETPDFVSLNTATASSLGDRGIANYNTGRNSLFSYFTRLDYAYKGKYLLNATFRRDGSSLFGSENRYANFPAVGLGWRMSDEQFMQGLTWLTDLKLRAGWGEMGSQSNVGAINQYSTFISDPSRTNYDINGNNTSASQGYRAGFEGNSKTKWETTETTNFGIDATILQGKWEFSLDIYQKDTRDLLVRAFRNGMEPLIDKPFINLGTMRNTGFDFTASHKGKFSREFDYDLTLTFTHYKNKMTKLNNEGTPRIVNLERLSNAIRTENGQPISSFHGFVIDGFYNSAEEIAKGPEMNGAVVGSWRYKDLDGDNKITDADRTYLGNPHPDFQMGLNIALNYKSFDFSAFFFWNQGNEIYNYVKYYTDMRVFVGGISTRVLNDSWTPDNHNAKLPYLAPGAANGFTSFTTSTSNSYYVEDGSYLRAKTIQLGYTLPKRLIGRLAMENARVYVQAQNLFTITKYTGPDPDLNIISRDPFGELRDLYQGVDLSGFPNPKHFLIGLSVTF
jgi:TonB-dependent starch-binding outer membrane protein SusC